MDNDSDLVRSHAPAVADGSAIAPFGASDIERLARYYHWVLRRMKLRFTERGLDSCDVEDAVGDVFLAILRRRRFVDDRAWFIAAASNRCRDLRARRARRDRVSSEVLDSAPDSRCEGEMEWPASLRDTLAKLNEFQHAVIVAHFFEGESLLEIARRNGATRKRVRWACERALLRLRIELSVRGADLGERCDRAAAREGRQSERSIVSKG